MTATERSQCYSVEKAVTFDHLDALREAIFLCAPSEKKLIVDGDDDATSHSERHTREQNRTLAT